jgi:hypothetical protein
MDPARSSQSAPLQVCLQGGDSVLKDTKGGREMKKQIEIYIRKSGERNLLMFHIPEELKESFIEGMKKGRFAPETANIGFEMSVLPQWQSSAQPNHMRLEVNEITVGYGE